jgi:hypothetical protein
MRGRIAWTIFGGSRCRCIGMGGGGVLLGGLGGGLLSGEEGFVFVLLAWRLGFRGSVV